MTDTAQPLAAESDGIAEAANAFKVALGQAEPTETERKRDEQGRFAAAEPEDEPAEITEPAEEEAEEAESDASADEDEAAEEAQPVDMPASWGKEQTEHWNALPPETQAFIAEREGERDKAVNQKFQEVANHKRGLDAQHAAALQTSRAEYAAMIDAVTGIIGQAQEPPITMLDPNSDDYDPDRFHLLRAQAGQTANILQALSEQRQSVAAQFEETMKAQGIARVQALNEVTRDALIRDVPDLGDPAKTGTVLQGLMDYAVSAGAPPEIFDDPTSALEWHFIWKAQQYDALQAAKAKAGEKPAPKPKPVQPPIRPGVTTPRAAIAKAQRDKAFDRLSKSGSIADGAEVFKHLLKG